MRGECGRWRSRFDCRSKAGCVRAGCPCAPHLSLPRKSSLSEKISQSARRGGRSPSCATSRMEATAAKGAAETAAAAEVAAKEVAAARMAVRVDAASKPNSFFLYAFLFQKKSTYSESNLGKFDANFHSRATIVFWMRSCRGYRHLLFALRSEPPRGLGGDHHVRSAGSRAVRNEGRRAVVRGPIGPCRSTLVHVCDAVRVPTCIVKLG